METDLQDEQRPNEIQPIESEIEDEKQDGPATSYRIIASPADFTLEVLHTKYTKSTIRIPSFQRGYVWTLSQASSLIESFLLGLPVPEMFLYREANQAWLNVIDGQQRLLSVSGFIEERFPSPKKPRKFQLTGVRSKWEGRTFSELLEEDRQKLCDATLRTIIVEQLSPGDQTSVYHIYKRLNTGGTSLTPQEVRKCVYQGPFNDLLLELNEDDAWRALYGRSDPNPRLRDVELVLRFLMLATDLDNYHKPMNDSLSAFMARHREDGVEDLGAFGELFRGTTQRAQEALGERPFRPKGGLNAAVYDSVMVAFANHPETPPADIDVRYQSLLEDDGYLDLVTKATTDETAVRSRLAKAAESLFENA